MPTNASTRLVAMLAQSGSDVGGGFHLLEAQLGVLMQVPARRDRFLFNGVGKGEDAFALHARIVPGHASICKRAAYVRQRVALRSLEHAETPAAGRAQPPAGARSGQCLASGAYTFQRTSPCTSGRPCA